MQWGVATQVLHSSGGNFRLLVKTGIELCLSPFAVSTRELAACYKADIKKKSCLDELKHWGKILHISLLFAVPIRILFCTHSPPVLPHLTIATTCSYTETSACGTLLGLVAMGTSKPSVKSISSIILFTLWFHMNSYAGTTERTQQAMVWHSPRIFKDNKLQNSLMAQQPPQQQQYNIIFSNFCIRVTDEDHQSHQALGYPRLIHLEEHYQKTIQSWNPIFCLNLESHFAAMDNITSDTSNNFVYILSPRYFGIITYV